LPHVSRALEKIPVVHDCKALHLIGAARNVEASNGDEAFKIIVHYDNGTTAEATMLYGIDLGDWWPYVITAPDRLVWTGSNPYSRKQGREIGIYHMKWENPHRDRIIASVDLIASSGYGAPFILALTAEP
jgi:hypothetical protein